MTNKTMTAKEAVKELIASELKDGVVDALAGDLADCVKGWVEKFPDYCLEDLELDAYFPIIQTGGDGIGGEKVKDPSLIFFCVVGSDGVNLKKWECSLTSMIYEAIEGHELGPDGPISKDGVADLVALSTMLKSCALTLDEALQRPQPDSV